MNVVISIVSVIGLAALCVFFVSRGSRTLVRHETRDDIVGVAAADRQMLAAQQQALDTLMEFIDAAKDPDPDKRYLLKVALTEGENTEHVWLEPVRWLDPGFEGLLAVDPEGLPNHKRGELVRPLPQQISDWAILAGDRTERGGYTMNVINGRR